MRIIEHREVQDQGARGAQVVEVLPAHEYERAHIRGAIHIPLRAVIKRAAELDKARPVIVYCRDAL